MYKNLLEGKSIVITGGTGSFGKTLLSFLAETNIGEIRVLSRDENKQDLLRNKFNSNKIKYFIGDVRDINSLYNCFSEADYVFHAAALKQVPSCEFNPIEAVKTNIIGSQNVIDAANTCKIKRAIMLSTDKAAMPINAMGISKSMMEKLAISVGLNSTKRDQTIFSITRYGNVMGSRGSVIPLFIDLIKQNKPIPVTDLEMTRFMMSLDESIELVLFAIFNGNQGELFVQKAPSASIRTLIQSLEKILNKKAIVNVIGPRHSEKKHETLLTYEEACRSIDLGNYFKVLPDIRDLNYTNQKNALMETDKNEFNSSNANLLNESELAELLSKQSFIKDLI